MDKENIESELIDKFQIIVYNNSGEIKARIICEGWEFPTDEMIKAVLTSNDGAYAEVHRVYELVTLS